MYLKIKHIFLGSILILLAACGQKGQVAVPYFNGPDFTPIWPAEGGDTNNLHKIGAFCFTNQDQDTISEKDYEGKVYVANFVFTTCGSICPKMTKHMKRVQEEMKAHSNELKFLSHSVMPWVDSPEKLKNYAEQMEVDQSNWNFVTGSKSDIYRIARTQYFIEEEPGFNKDSTEFLHTEHFALIDKESHIRGIYNGTLQLEMERLMEDLKLVLKE